eukprot:scaffold1884_cov343-Ochromonas_danica.AAC.45
MTHIRSSRSSSSHLYATNQQQQPSVTEERTVLLDTPAQQTKQKSVEEEDEELIERVSQEVLAESGVELDQLINPAKVVNLERDLVKLNKRLQESDLPANERVSIEEQIQKKRATLIVEKRSVMRGWLKNLFVFQSVLAAFISFAMVYDIVPNTHVPLSVQVLGFWMWWLFIIPSLRLASLPIPLDTLRSSDDDGNTVVARKPVDAEKRALDIAFLASPVVSLALPFATKDIPLIWWANAATVAACYGYFFIIKPNPEASQEEEEGKTVLPSWLVKAYKALDYGSGQERGARK